MNWFGLIILLLIMWWFLGCITEMCLEEENDKIENSVDLENWSAIENGVLGKGGLVKRLYSIDDYRGRYFRVKRE